jgi:hypothetical protein
MPTFTPTNASVSALVSELVRSALLEINAIQADETPSAADAAWGQEKLQRLIDQYNARRPLIYNVNFATFTLQANHSPHTIGPGGDFDVAVRPVELVAAALVLVNGGTQTDLPLYLGDDAWWAYQVQIKNLISTLPTGVYYSPDTPLGQLFFWPIPTVTNLVRLETWVGLAQAVNQGTRIAMPQGYWDALVLSLAKTLAPSFGAAALAIVSSPIFLDNWKVAMNAIEGNNQQSPRSSNIQSGMPNKNPASRPGFNFLTGKPW